MDHWFPVHFVVLYRLIKSRRVRPCVYQGCLFVDEGRHGNSRRRHIDVQRPSTEQTRQEASGWRKGEKESDAGVLYTVRLCSLIPSIPASSQSRQSQLLFPFHLQLSSCRAFPVFALISPPPSHSLTGGTRVGGG